ncbi:hypothetical protein [Sporosarcina sp. E16_8]|uniref:hypothetical protein n=1 Tax=Sporosarcina sp. E16_8 TaxID=2789295 RepID=UPI001A9106F5|nr:hypothetical protein [Sporosarcina sp. E16_8]MBO0588887.1 hypothetical protein [Sporosarcina sp. E16_8]
MIQQELFTDIKLIGVESGIISISYESLDFLPGISIDFYDEDTGVEGLLDSIMLGEFSPTKESYVMGDFDLNRIKNSEEAEVIKKQLNDKGKRMEPELVAKAEEFAKEIRERAGISVKVIPGIQGKPDVYTISDQNNWHADQVLAGIYYD